MGKRSRGYRRVRWTYDFYYNYTGALGYGIVRRCVAWSQARRRAKRAAGLI